ncbi:hypothetical protein [Pediococcus ethanolidurans]|uniref:Uncharacterized protein n=1 Tax=Pediococcus ethanolidurans TaxID=319653 RepID=A0A0R2K068_9LACO|nr:hypothetical protein [Pediococcus ethanolidurans]KRN82883.1 hypothetical protein IV87_GL001836 [Pediococcus ethanolidurans]GEN94703.1 hypothetical protein PET01_07530 [Pediococcus ethanolidurans]SER18145.1 hypothetical protein SAMN04487973_102161 [Pediococcus ethanolidurans]
MNQEKEGLPSSVEAFLMNHNIAVKQYKIRKTVIYFKDTKNVTYRYFKNNHILQSFVNKDWHDLIRSEDTKDISLF